MHRKIALAVLLMVIGSACGARTPGTAVERAGDRRPDTAISPVETPVVSTTDADPTSVPTSSMSQAPAVEVQTEPLDDETAPPADGSRVREPSPTGTTTTESIEDEDPVGLELAAEPTCVRTGEEVTVTVTTEPEMAVGMVVSYSDHQDHGQMGRFIADQNGIVLWRFIVGPDVPSGRALVAGVASTPNGERGNGAETTFEVADTLGCA
jgi:hypothetical protein